MNPAVSIITVYYNDPEQIKKLAASMKRNLKKDQYEWIVVDNNSTVELSSKLECIYLRQNINKGFGAACNLGAEHAKSEIFFFVNPDCEFIEDCISPLLDAIQTSAIAGPQVLYPDGLLQLSFGPFLSIFNEFKQRSLQRSEKTQDVQNWIREKAPKHPDYVSGCALMIRASIFRKLGGFDEQFFLYNEDVDLCKRAKEEGAAITYLPGVLIQHSKGTSGANESERVNQEYRKSQLRYYRKHHGPLQNLILRSYLRISGKMPSQLN
ncbi:MAG TPA: glycosyltransferase family 2 protein [Acidobacteriota bacterium]|nr:glycosyltransferase family 2 protein [Acidobacteriota bacterium]